jgi:hypothetical protein
MYSKGKKTTNKIKFNVTNLKDAHRYNKVNALYKIIPGSTIKNDIQILSRNSPLSNPKDHTQIHKIPILFSILSNITLIHKLVT